jgi:FkbH-like protein
MYETESNLKVEASAQVPGEVFEAFTQQGRELLYRTIFPWSEHCTECVWPTCYTTCDLYEPREDLRCRRFVDGMVRIECPGSVNSYILKITFKRWARLWAVGSLHLYTKDEAQRRERRDYRLGRMLQRSPLPQRLVRIAKAKRYSFKKRMAQRVTPGIARPSAFLLECYNPQDQVVPLTLMIRSLRPESKIPFQKLFRLTPGFQRIRVNIAEILDVVDPNWPISIDLTPDGVKEGTTLFFGLIDFVLEAPSSDDTSKKIKCVVWDLDNTLWTGTLIEDGVEKVRLKADIEKTILELDRRGILNSICTKNNEEDALQALKYFKMDGYFLYPQISWQPKSEGIRRIASELNIGLGSILFVDDSDFELQEVASTCPEVMVLQAERYKELPDLPECKVPATLEAGMRRNLYRVDATRKAVARSFGQDYMAFLRHCQINLRIEPLSDENIERVYELTQRTNQMNFSGNRYTRDLLETIGKQAYLDAYVLACEDRFGNYGIVGFSIVDTRGPRMTDLMFSCRVQGKRVEHAFLNFLIRKYTPSGHGMFSADYRRTLRNAPSGRVFSDIGFEEVEQTDGVTRLVFPNGKIPIEDGIVNIIVGEVTKTPV